MTGSVGVVGWWVTLCDLVEEEDDEEEDERVPPGLGFSVEEHGGEVG